MMLTSFYMPVCALLGGLLVVASQAPPMISAIFKLTSAQVKSKQNLASSLEFVAFEKCTPERLRSILFKFSVEGFDLRLPPGPGDCIPQNSQVIWGRVSFEGDVSYIKEDDRKYNMEGNDLVIKNAEPDLASYFSMWKLGQDEILSIIWTVDIVPIRNLEQVKARSWKNSLMYHGSELEINVKWGDWSPCSRCDGIAGRRHRFGFCSVKIKSWAGLEMLASYKQSISCSLLLNLRPDYLAEKLQSAHSEDDHEDLRSMQHALAKPPLVMMGFCRQTTCGESAPQEVFHGYPFQFRRMFYSGRRNLLFNNNKNEEKESEVASSSWIWFMKGLINGVPIGWDNIPEIIALISLIVLQLYILKLVWWNKKDAK